MLLRQIKYFVTVVDTGSFTEAAEECFISQSAISQQILSLEKELGVQLLVRSTRRFTLTEPGKYLYSHGKSLVDYDSMVVLTHFKGHSMGATAVFLKTLPLAAPTVRLAK